MLIDRSCIQKAKEKLGNEMADIIVRELGLEEQYDSKNMKMCCPFHEEDHASFIWNPKALSFHCFGSCGRSYDLLDIYMSKGDTYLEAVQKLFKEAGVTYAFGELGVPTRTEFRYPHPEHQENKEQVYKYLATRKISKETADYLDLGQDANGNIAFHYYDTNDVLTMVKYRPSHKIDKVKGESKNWKQKDTSTAALLFNMNRINSEQPLLITSGELDCAAAIEAGWHNAVSIPFGDQNTQWVEENYDWLEQFDSVIVCPDNDASGTKYCNEIIPRLGSWRTKVAIIPKEIERNGKSIPIKDLNEALYWLGKEETLKLIVHAKDSPVPSVKDLSDVHDVDYDAIDGVRIGIEPLDNELMRLFFGTLTIISGQPGSGKTSFLSQVMCQCLDQGKNCWLFSGELPEPMSKNWINYILAGRRNLVEKTGKDGAPYYVVSKEVKQTIDDFYRGKWFIYRDDYQNDLDDLLISMTDVVRKYGVKLLILDNMMTIDTNLSDDELRTQTETIKKLIAFSQKYVVATVLVCHPRKLKDTSKVGIYDIAGTSNIQNLAHRTIGLRRVLQDEKEAILASGRVSERTRKLLEYDVIADIVKDRMCGRSNISIGMYYDPLTRRFYTSKQEFDYKYDWDKRNYEDELKYPHENEYTEDEVFGREG